MALLEALPEPVENSLRELREQAETTDPEEAAKTRANEIADNGHQSASLSSADLAVVEVHEETEDGQEAEGRRQEAGGSPEGTGNRSRRQEAVSRRSITPFLRHASALSTRRGTLQTMVYAGSQTLPMSYSTPCPSRRLASRVSSP